MADRADRKYTVESVGEKIHSFLGPVIGNAGLDLTFQVVPGQETERDFENPDLSVQFSGPDVDLILANRAEALLAFEYLTMETLGIPSSEHDRICFDAHDYRSLRIEELRLSAQVAAEKVKSTGRPFEFGPMTSRERRIIHLALRHDSAVRSESAGAGPMRHAVIYPADMPSREVAIQDRYRRPTGRRR